MSNSAKKADQFLHVHSNKSIPIKFFDKNAPSDVPFQISSLLINTLKNGRIDRVIDGIYGVCKFIVNQEKEEKIKKTLDDLKSDLEKYFPLPADSGDKQYKSLFQYHVAIINQLIELIYTHPEFVSQIAAKNQVVGEKIADVQQEKVLQQVHKFVVNVIVHDGVRCKEIIESSSNSVKQHPAAVILLACHWAQPQSVVTLKR